MSGTPFRLRYTSSRVPGSVSTLTIPLSGDILPPTPPLRIDLEVDVGGRQFTQSFPAAPNETYLFTWDGLDVYGRHVQGPQLATVRVGYVYRAVYAKPDEQDPSFASFGVSDITLAPARDTFTLWQVWQRPIGGWNARSEQDLGGWMLSVHHAYDPVGRVLYLGDGTQRSAQSLPNIISTVAGSVAGIAPGLIGGDGGPATAAILNLPFGMAVSPDGSLYIADTGSNRIRRVAPDGIITTVAGNGQSCFLTTARCGDGGRATFAQLNAPYGVAVGPDGSLYIADRGNSRIRRVTPDGIITTVAGNGQQCVPTMTCGDGGPATAATLNRPFGVAVGPDGSLYIADRFRSAHPARGAGRHHLDRGGHRAQLHLPNHAVWRWRPGHPGTGWPDWRRGGAGWQPLHRRS